MPNDNEWDTELTNIENKERKKLLHANSIRNQLKLFLKMVGGILCIVLGFSMYHCSKHKCRIPVITAGPHGMGELVHLQQSGGD